MANVEISYYINSLSCEKSSNAKNEEKVFFVKTVKIRCGNFLVFYAQYNQTKKVKKRREIRQTVYYVCKGESQVATGLVIVAMENWKYSYFHFSEFIFTTVKRFGGLCGRMGSIVK